MDEQDENHEPVPEELENHAFAILPDTTKEEIRLAWEQSKWRTNEGDRQQIALNILFDFSLLASQGPRPTPEVNGPAPLAVAVAAAQPGPAPRSPESPVRRMGMEAKFDPGNDAEDVIVPTYGDGKEKKELKGKGKAIAVIEISDDDEDEEEDPAIEEIRRREAAEAARSSKSKGKGKGKGKKRAYSHSPELEARPINNKKNKKRQLDQITLEDTTSDDEGPVQPRKRVNFRTPTPALTPALNSNSDLDDFLPPPIPALVAAPILSQLDLNLASILSIIPDVLPEYVLGLLQSQPATAANDDLVQIVMEVILSDEKGYPKAVRKGGEDLGGVGGSGGSGGGDEVDWMNWKKRDLGTGLEKTLYNNECLDRLLIDFPFMPKPTLREILLRFDSFYAPTYFELAKEVEKTPQERGWKDLVNSRADAIKGKGKAKEVMNKVLRDEIEWVEKTVEIANAEKENERLREIRAEEEMKRGEFFECGCCFSEFGFSLLATCTEGCQFCRDCAKRLAENRIGDRQYTLPCMSTDKCAAFFSLATAGDFLPLKLVETLHKIKQEKEVDLAELQGLFKCPFCPFAVIIENEEEKLLRCQRVDCGKVSCLKCQEEDHLPKSCEEVKEDKGIGGLHAVEEAMSEAFIRKCPKCSASYVKETGCNKITCTTCGTMSCYICMKIVTGYEHFKNAGTNARFTEKGATCVLWDDTDKRNFDEVEAARRAAVAGLGKDDKDVRAGDLDKLNLPKPVPKPPGAAPVAGPAALAYPVHYDELMGRYYQQLANPVALHGRAAAIAAVGGHRAAAVVPPPIPRPPRQRRAMPVPPEFNARIEAARAKVEVRMQALRDLEADRAGPVPAAGPAQVGPRAAAAAQELAANRERRLADAHRVAEEQRNRMAQLRARLAVQQAEDRAADERKAARAQRDRDRRERDRHDRDNRLPARKR